MSWSNVVQGNYTITVVYDGHHEHRKKCKDSKKYPKQDKEREVRKKIKSQKERGNMKSKNEKGKIKSKQDRFTTYFKTCGTGPLISEVGVWVQSPLVSRLPIKQTRVLGIYIHQSRSTFNTFSYVLKNVTCMPPCNKLTACLPKAWVLNSTKSNNLINQYLNMSM